MTSHYVILGLVMLVIVILEIVTISVLTDDWPARGLLIGLAILSLIPVINVIICVVFFLVILYILAVEHAYGLPDKVSDWLSKPIYTPRDKE